jgi:drug/metabolite transporter (DMT)-like permease
MNPARVTPAELFPKFAPLIFVLLWSTGFIGTKLGTPFAEPFTFLALRFALVLILLFPILIFSNLRKGNAPLAGFPATPRAWLHIGVSGVLLHGLYLGGVFYAIHAKLPAGITAVMVGLQPILAAVLAPFVLREKINARAWIGLGLGFAGVLIVVSEKLLGKAHLEVSNLALVAAGIALLGTTFGTLYQKKFCSSMPLLGGTIVQYLFALAVMLPVALFSETMRIIWTGQFIFAMVWLVLVLSIGAISILMYLISRDSSAKTNGLFYLVPPLTAIEAYFLFGEKLGFQALLGMIVVIVGVYLVVAAPKKG